MGLQGYTGTGRVHGDRESMLGEDSGGGGVLPDSGSVFTMTDIQCVAELSSTLLLL